MNIKITKKQCILAIFSLICAITAEVIFIKLGFWQERRMLEKEQIVAEYKQSLTKEPVNLSFNNKQWQKVVTTGYFDHARTFALDNQTYQGAAGFKIITPFIINDTEVLVDRGWVARNYDIDYLNEFNEPIDEVEITGIVKNLPTRKSKWGGPTFSVNSRTLLFLDANVIETKKDRLPFLVQLQTSNNSKIIAFLDEPKNGDKHKEYLITWFGFALVLAAMYGYVAIQFVRKIIS